jgi:hypothetical protein
MDQSDGCVIQPEKSCDNSRQFKTRPRAWPLGALTRSKRVRVGLPIIGATSVLPACNGSGFDALHPDWPDDSITPWLSERVSLGKFRRRTVVIRFKGTRRVTKKQGGRFGRATGTMTWSATVKLRKVVIPEDCRERPGGSPFVCRL